MFVIISMFGSRLLEITASLTSTPIMTCVLILRRGIAEYLPEICPPKHHLPPLPLLSFKLSSPSITLPKLHFTHPSTYPGASILRPPPRLPILAECLSWLSAYPSRHTTGWFPPYNTVPKRKRSVDLLLGVSLSNMRENGRIEWSEKVD